MMAAPADSVERVDCRVSSSGRSSDDRHADDRAQLTAREILDSRGRPTVAATCDLASGAIGIRLGPVRRIHRARPRRWSCATATRAATAGSAAARRSANVNGAIADALARPRRSPTRRTLDRALIELDGTPNKSRLGANAILAVSLAFARAGAAERGVPLYQHFADMLGASRAPTLPRLTINLFSGGKHAGGQVPIQDVLVVPRRAHDDRRGAGDDLRGLPGGGRADAAQVRHPRRSTADEGGLAPPFPDVEAMLADAVEAIRAGGVRAGDGRGAGGRCGVQPFLSTTAAITSAARAARQPRR